MPHSREALRGEPAAATMDRFLGFVVESQTGSGCWLWQGKRNKKGYGNFKLYGCFMLAHRVSWALSRGLWPGRWVIRHRCSNPSCVNPEHLFRGTQSQNEKDKRSRRGRSRYRYFWKNQYAVNRGGVLVDRRRGDDSGEAAGDGSGEYPDDCGF